VVASCTATLANQAVQIGITRRVLAGVRFERALVSRATIRQVLSFGAWTSVNGVGQLLASTAPILLLNRFARPLDVAMFHVGRLPDVQLRGLLQAIEGPAQPALIGLYAREGKRALDPLYFRGGRFYLWLVLLPVAPMLVFGVPLYRLYAGEEYARSGLVMAALLASYPLLYASGMFYRVAHASGRIGAFQAYFLVVQLASVAALAYAVVGRGTGAVGAAVALAATQGLLHLVLIWPLGLRLVAGGWREFARQTLARGLLPFAAALALCAAIAARVDVDSWLGLGFVACAAAAVYVAVLVGVCLDEPDRELLLRALRRLRPRLARGPRDERA
jgi:O-antigen/teichoic acid export membrane protein